MDGWIHVVSDVAIFLAYAAVPVLLVWFTRCRRDAPLLPIFWLFAAIIQSCAFEHLVEATILKSSWCRFSGLFTVITTVVSLATVVAPIPAASKAFALPGLVVTNKCLQDEIDGRRKQDE